MTQRLVTLLAISVLLSARTAWGVLLLFCNKNERDDKCFESPSRSYRWMPL